MLAYRTTTGSAPAYFHPLMTIYIPSRSLRSASERRLMVPSQRVTKSLSRTFSFTVPGWWNEFPTPIRNAEFPNNSQATPENSSSIITWHLLLKKRILCSVSLISPCPASFCSEQCLTCCITSTSRVCLPFYNVSLIVFLNCKSLWIKASAKWININVNKNPTHVCSIHWCTRTSGYTQLPSERWRSCPEPESWHRPAAVDMRMTASQSQIK